MNCPSEHALVPFLTSDIQVGPLVKYQPALNHLTVGTRINKSRNVVMILKISEVFFHGVMARLSNNAINESANGAVKYLSATPPR